MEFALQFEGYDYVWGGKEPATGFDCSGLVYYVFHYFNYPVGRTATAQWAYEDSWEVSPAQLLPGDLVFFSDTYSLDNITMWVFTSAMTNFSTRQTPAPG